MANSRNRCRTTKVTPVLTRRTSRRKTSPSQKLSLALESAKESSTRKRKRKPSGGRRSKKMHYLIPARMMMTGNFNSIRSSRREKKGIEKFLQPLMILCLSLLPVLRKAKGRPLPGQQKRGR